MTPDNFIKAQLLLVSYREAYGSGGIDNIKAIMFVMRNRVNGGWMGGDWLRVIENQKFVSGNLDRYAHIFGLHPDLRDPEMRIVLNLVDDIFSGQAPDAMTDGALYYARLDAPLTEWFKKNVAGKQEEHPRVAKIGQVDFFR